MKPFTIILHISLLAASSTIDARTTVSLRNRSLAAGTHFTEYCPMMRPFVSNPVLTYGALIAGDQAVYWGLRAIHKPRAAQWWARVEAAENMVCAVNNARQHPVKIGTVGFAPVVIGAPIAPVRGRR